VETPIRALAIPRGDSESANVIKVSPVFPKSDKYPALMKRGTKTPRTELELFIIGTVCPKEVFSKGWTTNTRGKNEIIILRKRACMSISIFL
jgi:hypothetical protein